MIRLYKSLMTHLKTANISSRKHVMDNKVSGALKSFIRDEYKMELEIVPLVCHLRNAAEVAIRNFKAYFLSIIYGVAD